jgi:hypothetical protein
MSTHLSNVTIVTVTVFHTAISNKERLNYTGRKLGFLLGEADGRGLNHKNMRTGKKIRRRYNDKKGFFQQNNAQSESRLCFLSFYVVPLPLLQQDIFFYLQM